VVEEFEARGLVVSSGSGWATGEGRPATTSGWGAAPAQSGLTKNSLNLAIAKPQIPRRVPHRAIRHPARSPSPGRRLAIEYNTYRPHGSLDDLTPEAFRQQWLNNQVDVADPQ